jgi:DnaK suppressor protein
MEAAWKGVAIMTPQLMSQLKEVLKTKEAGLMAEFRKARERLYVPLITDRFVGDRIDEARIFAERDLAARHINFNWALLRQVRSALQAMDEGSYGQCLACDQEIPPKRLLASPWSLYCVPCQEWIEQGAGVGPSQAAEISAARQHYRLAS